MIQLFYKGNNKMAKKINNLLKYSKPNTPGTRGQVKVNKTFLWKGSSEKSLTKAIKNTGGRNNLGRITCYGKKNSKRRLYRQIDFVRNDKINGINGVVERIEYDPNRTAHIALIKYIDNTKSYVIATKNMKIGTVISCGPQADTLEGNCLPLAVIPVGSQIHNIEIQPNKGAQMVRSAGTSAILVGKELGKAVVSLPSKELRYFSLECKAVLGIVSNEVQFNEKLGNAGSGFYRNRRPKVRGVAKNPIDHANGGNTSGGKVFSNFNGNVIKGKKTRKKNKWSNNCIISRRKKKGTK
jgi:large subunit ribosomal protein L2